MNVYACLGFAAPVVKLIFTLWEMRSAWHHFLRRAVEAHRAFLRFVRRGFKLEDREDSNRGFR